MKGGMVTGFLGPKKKKEARGSPIRETPELLAEQRRRFVQVFQYLASDAATQIKHSPAGVSVGEDLRLMSHFLGWWSTDLLKAGLIGQEADLRFREIDSILGDLPEKEAPLFLTPSAVRAEKGWAAVRDRA
jgi:hypothetical protein